MTKSIPWRSTMGARPRRTKSRPGRPTMSPMKRIRTMRVLGGTARGPNRHLDRLTAPVGNLGNRDAQLTVVEGGARPACIAGPVQPHDPGEASEAALDEVEGCIRMGPARRFFSGDEHRIGLDEDSNPPR